MGQNSPQQRGSPSTRVFPVLGKGKVQDHAEAAAAVSKGSECA